MKCVLFGATGYIGGRLAPELLAAGHRVRAAARVPGRLDGIPWADRVEVVRADVLDPASVALAVAGQDVIFYLVHGLGQRGFAERDRRAAQNVARAAAEAGVGRIVYLGGLHPAQGELSPHLRSRTEVGRIFLDSPVATAALQAAVIIGSGSASFEMLRYLTERLPAMVTPRWVHNRIQPIAIRDVLRCLVGTVELPSGLNRTFDIGGPDILTYLQMMRRYAVVAGLPRRWVVPVPVLTPWLSAQWVNLVTPVPRSIAVPLIESLVHEVVCDEHDITTYVPDPPEGLLHFDRAVELALPRMRQQPIPARWSSAGWPDDPSLPAPNDPGWSGGTLYEDVRERQTAAAPEALWRVIERIGGEHGSDRSRWRVGPLDPLDRGTRVLLRADSKAPGRAWLEISVDPNPHGGTVLRQHAYFEPRGLAGHLYWKAISPFHPLVFGRLIHDIADAAEHGGASAFRR